MVSNNPPTPLGPVPEECENNIVVDSFTNGLIEESIKDLSNIFALIRLNDLPQMKRDKKNSYEGNIIQFYALGSDE